MIGILLLAAAQTGTASASSSPWIKPPELQSGGIIGYRDYPAASLRRGEYGIVSVLLHVSSEGSVSACDVTESSGFPALDDKSCALLMMRSRFDPAKDADNNPVSGEYRTATTWGIDQHQPRALIELPLQVASLPPGYKNPVEAQLLFDATGHVSACHVRTTSGNEGADRAACAYVTRELTITPPKARSGVKAVAVRTLRATLSDTP
jgi:TonB family protein